MVSPPPLSLALYSDVPVVFAHPSNDSAGKLGAMINKEIGKEITTSLDALLLTISKQILLSSFGNRESIDDYVNLTIFTALQINSEAVDVGRIIIEGEGIPHKSITPIPISGPEILGESLAKTLFDELRSAISRSRSPVEDWDRAKSMEYYYKASIHATVLARAFALTDIFRDLLWKVIEDILVKGLFSGDEPEPGNFIVLTCVMLGAGQEIEEYMGGGEEGIGKNWSWYDNVRIKRDERWGWKEVVSALKQLPGRKMVDRLPEYVKDSLKLAKKHVGDGKVGESWDSKRLASKAFKWGNVDLDKLGI